MALTTHCSDDRQCMAHDELFTDFKGVCYEYAEHHSTLCEQHGGLGEFESFLEEWEHWIVDVDEICEHIDDGEDTAKVEAFKRGELSK